MTKFQIIHCAVQANTTDV